MKTHITQWSSHIWKGNSKVIRFLLDPKDEKLFVWVISIGHICHSLGHSWSTL